MSGQKKRQAKTVSRTHTAKHTHSHTPIWLARESTTLPTTLLNSLEKPRAALASWAWWRWWWVSSAAAAAATCLPGRPYNRSHTHTHQHIHTHTRSTKFHAITTHTHRQTGGQTDTSCCRCCCFFADSLIKYLVAAHWQVCRHWQGPGSNSSSAPASLRLPVRLCGLFMRLSDICGRCRSTRLANNEQTHPYRGSSGHFYEPRSILLNEHQNAAPPPPPPPSLHTRK